MDDFGDSGHQRLFSLWTDELDPLFWPLARTDVDSAWTAHVPFAHWLVAAHRPLAIVELGTHNGVSYSAFCEAVQRAKLDCRCLAVDTWKGDEQAGFYGEEVYADLRRFHDARYAGFSDLIRSTFDEALDYVPEASIDLLHIDGFHTYQAVRDDFEKWRTRLSDRAVVLFHDTNVREREFGVWRLWAEISSQYPSFEFLHGHGLGVLAVGPACSEPVLALTRLSSAAASTVRERFAFLGERWKGELLRRLTQAHHSLEIQHRDAEIQQRDALRHEVDVRVRGLEAELAAERAQISEHQRLLSEHQRLRAEAAERAANARRDTFEALAEVARVEQELADAREQVHGQLSEARREAAEAREQARIASLQRDTVLNSTAWRATWPLRSLGGRVPRSARRGLRRAARLAWWTATLQLRSRLRERRAILQRVREVAASPQFDAGSYVARYPDVAASGLDPALHYVTVGAAEGRDASPGGRAPEAPQAEPAPAGPAPTLSPASAAVTAPEPLLDPVYDRWVREHDTLSDDDRNAIRSHIGRLPYRPAISVVMPAYETPERLLREAIASVRAQLYPHWELCIADDASPSDTVTRVLEQEAAADPRIKWVRRESNGHIAAATNSALALATGEFVALMDHDDLLAEHALYEVAVELNTHPDADLIYTDEDKIDSAGRRYGAYFKPDWNIDLLLGHNLFSHLGVYRKSLLERTGGLREGLVDGSQDYDLILRCAAATAPSRIRHIPAVLYHWRRMDASSSFSQLQLDRCIDAARRSVHDYLRSQGVDADVLPAPSALVWNRVRWPMPEPAPRVSVIVPSRDQPELLARCAGGLLHRTDYPRLEVLIVDNETVDPAALDLLCRLQEDRRVRVLPFPGPFNYAALNNAAVREATGDIIVLLNNDIDVIDGGWLREMVSNAVRPDVGAVGARLLYGDGRIQHAGVVLGVGSHAGGPGIAGHFGAFAPETDIGYFCQYTLARELSAVTGACLAMRRDLYLALGGLDAEHLAVSFNDVDLCLRIRAHGLRIVWTPFAELYHIESATRGLDVSPEQVERAARESDFMRQQWGSVLDADPFYNPNFSRIDHCFKLAFPPNREKPWRRQGSDAKVDTRSRAEILLAPVPRGGRIIEIGPRFNPTAPKAAGWDAHTLDHLTREGLIEKYKVHPNVDVSRIEEVDYVWTGGPLSDAVPSALHGSFDAFIASHVIEHTPDLIAFLESAATLLKPEGVVVLVVPDKRYCFDYFQPLSTTGQVLAAHAEERSRHTRRLGFDQVAYAATNDGAGAWGQHPVQAIRLMHKIESAQQLFTSMGTDHEYVDMHAWRFTPSSFELMLLELARLGATDWRVERASATEGCEFFAWLRRGGQASAGSLSPEALDALRLALLKRILLETRVQTDWLLAGEPELATSEGQPNAAAPTTSPAAIPASKDSAPDSAPAISTPRFVDWFPAPENAGRAFAGEWSSAVPGLPTTGHAALFDDGRISWFEERIGGFAGKRVLELGPLEGGHTYMMTQRGATVLAIESNLRAWMRCLVAKDTVGMPGATFLLGDFVKYLANSPPRFDFALASGVLYHMPDPVTVLRNLCGASDAIGLWTHYFDADVLQEREQLRGKFDFVPRVVTTPRGRRVHLHAQRYLDALAWSGFCGGDAPGSNWLRREDILGVLEDEGFLCETFPDQSDHPNGPAFCVFARKG